jgi:hypothetical protein
MMQIFAIVAITAGVIGGGAFLILMLAEIFGRFFR